MSAAHRSRSLHLTVGPDIMTRARTIILLLALSASLNVLISWACILWSPYTRSEHPPERENRTLPDMSPGPDGIEAWWWVGEGFGIADAVPSGAALMEGGEFMRYWRGSGTPAFYRAGWPMLSMQSVVTAYRTSEGGNLSRWGLPFREILRRGLQTSWMPRWLHAREERRLPVLPLWAGFVINSALYFTVLFGFWFLWRRIFLAQQTGCSEPRDCASVSIRPSPARGR
jgi:hypothetical protein